MLVLYLIAGGLGAGIATADWGAGLPPPGGLAVTPAQTTLLLTWDSVNGATSYGVYLDGTPNRWPEAVLGQP